MSIPDMDIPIKVVRLPWEWLMKHERAVEKVQERLERTTRALDHAGVAHAVIGGNAVAIWVSSRDPGATRNTKDVDILLARDDLARATAAMTAAGFELAEVNGITMFLEREDPIPSRGVHIVFAGEKIKPHDPYPAPRIKVGLRDPNNVPALDLGELLVLKLVAFRDIDRVHIRDMLKVGLIDDSADYEEIKELFEYNLSADVPLFNEYHALLVQVGKRYCRPLARCAGCPLEPFEHHLE